MDRNSKAYSDYLVRLQEIPTMRRNEIYKMVSAQIPEEEMGLTSDIERELYADLMDQAKAHLDTYGFWPEFELEEIEYDNPALDIYK